MSDLLELAADLWRATAPGDDLRLVGGLAVRLYGGEPARVTADIDVVAMTDEAREALLDHLRSDGWRIGQTGAWWRAARSTRALIDIARHPVVSPRTFDEMTLRAPPKKFVIFGVDVVAAGADDLAVLKLTAQRDQDWLDLVTLAAAGCLDARAIGDAAEADDIERRVSEGAEHARATLESGRLAELIEEVTAAPADPSALDALGRLLADLKKEGI